MNHPSERLTALRTTALRAAMVTALGAMSSNALAASNFTMLDPSGGIVGGTNDVAATWDGTFNTSASSTNFNMTLSSTYPFFGYVWTAHHIRVFEPGTYTINTECTTGSSSPADLDAGTCTPNADPAKNYTLTVGAGQIGAHMLFDWNVSSNIDVLQVWDVAAVFGPSPMYTGAAGGNAAGTRWGLMSRDIDGDGYNGQVMIDGPFAGFNANFNVELNVNSSGNNFTMLDPSGGIVGGTNDVAATWDGTFNTSASSTNFNMTLSSTYPFFGYVWTAHHIRVFEPGTYTINTECTTGSSSPADLDAGTCTPNADPAKNYTLTVGAGQIGAHMLFDWNVSSNIDVLQVWDVAAVFGPSPMYTGAAGGNAAGTRWGLMSRDIDGDGYNGQVMIDGPFAGFNANFNVGLSSTASGTLGTSSYTPTVNVGDPSNTPSCSINTKPVNALERADWWLVAGFLAWLGALRKRFKRQAQS